MGTVGSRETEGVDKYSSAWLDRVLKPLYTRADERGPRDERSDVGAIYRRAAQQTLLTRNPVIVIPGIMGSRLVAKDARRSIWGDFLKDYVRPDSDDGARLIALPMERGVPLDRLTGEARSDGSLADVRCKFAGIPLRRRVYGNVLSAMGVRNYAEVDEHEIDEHEGDAAAFEFDYDWRRSLDESAVRFGRFLKQLARFIKAYRPYRSPLRFDVVAHSMGGLLLRYFLRYGTQYLAYDGSSPRLTWEGASLVETAVFIATPNAGALMGVDRLLSGLNANAVLPAYNPAIIGTMPSLYQLLPRTRHGRVLVAGEREPVDLLDPAVWVERKFGLADPARAKQLERLLPDVDGDAARRDVAIDHLKKCLASARAFQEALDVPAPGRPAHLRLHLFAGDTVRTPSEAVIDPLQRTVRTTAHAPGDRIVLRSSALLDERAGQEWRPRLESPIDWSSVTFVPGDHLGITKEPVTINNILYRLLEQPAAMAA